MNFFGREVTGKDVMGIISIFANVAFVLQTIYTIYDIFSGEDVSLLHDINVIAFALAVLLMANFVSKGNRESREIMQKVVFVIVNAIAFLTLFFILFSGEIYFSENGAVSLSERFEKAFYLFVLLLVAYVFEFLSGGEEFYNDEDSIDFRSSTSLAFWAILLLLVFIGSFFLNKINFEDDVYVGGPYLILLKAFFVICVVLVILRDEINVRVRRLSNNVYYYSVLSLVYIAFPIIISYLVSLNISDRQLVEKNSNPLEKKLLVLNEKIVSLTSANSKLENENNELESNVLALEVKLSEKDKLLEGNSSRGSIFENRFKESKKEIKALKSKLNSYVANEENLKIELDSANMEVEHLNARLLNLKEEYDAFYNEISRGEFSLEGGDSVKIGLGSTIIANLGGRNDNGIVYYKNFEKDDLRIGGEDFEIFIGRSLEFNSGEQMCTLRLLSKSYSGSNYDYFCK